MQLDASPRGFADFVTPLCCIRLANGEGALCQHKLSKCELEISEGLGRGRASEALAYISNSATDTLFVLG